MNKKPLPGQVRIIAGKWRGRKLAVVDSEGLRPTPDRVRETLFNWLMPKLANARCLDCFAGSGALGLEALSRHAGEVILLERERQVARQLERHLALLSCPQGQVVCTDTLAYLRGAGRAQDIVFVDPPFASDLLAPTLSLLESHGWLAAGAMVYVECGRQTAVPVPAGWRLWREQVAGQVRYQLYQRGDYRDGLLIS